MPPKGALPDVSVCTVPAAVIWPVKRSSWTTSQAVSRAAMAGSSNLRAGRFIPVMGIYVILTGLGDVGKADVQNPGMKRGIIAIVVLLVLFVCLLFVFGPERYQQMTADKARILTAVNAYVEDLWRKGIAAPAHVTLDELTQGGFLTGEDAAGRDTKTKVPSSAHGVRRSEDHHQPSSRIAVEI
jgi:hypothetical protein